MSSCSLNMNQGNYRYLNSFTILISYWIIAYKYTISILSLTFPLQQMFMQLNHLNLKFPYQSNSKGIQLDIIIRLFF
jgi:hypothetical protein